MVDVRSSMFDARSLIKSKEKLVFSIIILGLVLAPLFLSDFRVNLLGKFIAYAILAIGLDLIWGFTGILSLGHGVFFGLGAYCMAMYLKLEAAHGKLPDFMSWSGLEGLPWFWKLFSNSFFAIAMAILVPTLLAFFIGFLTFKNRIRGVYFSILSQALAIIFVTLFVGQQAYTGGTNGLTNYKSIMGFSLSNGSTKLVLYYISIGLLVLIYVFCNLLIKRRLGRILVAIRDGENRVRFSGYNPTTYKIFVYCLSAAIAGLAGAIFVPQVGIISPAEMGIVPSIEMIIWVAIGGRGTLIGAVIGAILVNALKSGISESFPDVWSYFIGFAFIFIVLFMPNGIVGLIKKIAGKFGNQAHKGGQQINTDKAA
ncbi:urea ABC transporter permease subunit UrtC [Desulfosporosinus metallidurans]|uniref:Urea ABC transporter, permease protein UrtC n=1 Tax=Desulfosporosinus metallidurans TaxID=1888891 RepID=A0A1Q8QXQ1_9FIRM|nr:urea ABC transporter permease subunit UrtC [Desulfosporosinus metallidurans]OLN32000.1 Urea ABC transporter, permease protein UrtC [Desulfosporosinus metallidurans]